MKNIHVLPTDKPSRLHYYNSIDPLGLSKEYLQWKEGRNIYITSDEEIKVGDWVYSEARNTLFKVKSKATTSVGTLLIEDDVIMPLEINEVDCKKIILTTDVDLIKDGVQAIDDKFLEWFVKNPSCEFVKVREKGNVHAIVKGVGIKSFSNGYKIIIPKEEPKQETLEEVANTYFETLPEPYNEYLSNPKNGFIAGAKWQQEQDKKMYSLLNLFLEELKDKIDSFEFSVNQNSYINEYINDWFEQFKKK